MIYRIKHAYCITIFSPADVIMQALLLITCIICIAYFLKVVYLREVNVVVLSTI